MKPFAEFLQERFLEGRVKEFSLMQDGSLPLSPSILKNFEIFIPKTHHVTSYRNVEDIVKLQGKRKTIATFTRGSRGISMGALASGDMLFTLEGYSSFSSTLDFTSKLDRNGIRWIDRWNLNDKDYVVKDKFMPPMFSAIEKKYNLPLDHWAAYEFTKTLDNKGKAEFISFYFQQAKKIITKSFLDALQKSLSKGFNAGGFDNNEILLYNFKIKKVEVIVDKLNDPASYIKDLRKYSNIKIDGTIDRNDVAKIRGK